MPFTICDLYLLSIDHVLSFQSKSALKIFANKLIALHKSWPDQVGKLKVFYIFVYWREECAQHQLDWIVDTELEDSSLLSLNLTSFEYSTASELDEARVGRILI